MCSTKQEGKDSMRIKIEIDKNIQETELVIRTFEQNEQVDKLYRNILEKMENNKIPLFKGATEFYMVFSEILFFETDERNINAHTKSELYETKLRLYELEKMVPQNFMRISKSTIVNLDKVYALTHALTGNLIEFHDSYKQVYVSRRYFKDVKRALESKEN